MSYTDPCSCFIHHVPERIGRLVTIENNTDDPYIVRLDIVERAPGMSGAFSVYSHGNSIVLPAGETIPVFDYVIPEMTNITLKISNQENFKKHQYTIPIDRNMDIRTIIRNGKEIHDPVRNDQDRNDQDAWG